MVQGQWKLQGIAPYSHSAAIFLFVPHLKNLLLLLFSLEGVQELYLQNWMNKANCSKTQTAK